VVGNFVIAEVGANGRVDIYNHDGNTHVVFDVVGYYPTAARTQIGAGDRFSCALDAVGDPWCWGYNASGRLGDGTATNRLVPTRVSNLSNLRKLAVGYYTTCAIDSENVAWCWGVNGYAQIGDGTVTNRSTPVRVSGLPPSVAIAPWGTHSCSVDLDGGAWCWGRNNAGQLGDGTTTQRRTPVQVQNLPAVVDIAVGDFHTCALDTGGETWCWGANSNGQLGDGNVVSGATPRPQRVQGLPNARALDAQGGHTCAIAAVGGTQWCWGANPNGVLGDGTTARRPLPVQTISLTGVRSTSSTSNHRCATDAAWRPWCWGYNRYYGQLGDGTTTTRYVPTPVVELNRVREVAGGSDHSCAVDHAGAPWCWGRNAVGQLGDGTTVTRLTPTRATPYP
jgi:alpha-tubulin suppressor-like RCC1 family protein